MKIAIAGTGYVGLSNAMLLAQHNEVIAVDIISERVKLLTSKISPIEDDDIEMKIWKLAPITIKNENSNKGDKIRTILPLKAIVKYRIGTKKLGIEMYDTREFHLAGVVTLISEIS